MPIPSRTAEELSKGAKHVNYEVQALRHFAATNLTDSLTIELFLLHARNLIEFIGWRVSSYDDDLIVGSTTYRPGRRPLRRTRTSSRTSSTRSTGTSPISHGDESTKSSSSPPQLRRSPTTKYTTSSAPRSSSSPTRQSRPDPPAHCFSALPFMAGTPRCRYTTEDEPATDQALSGVWRSG